MFSGISQHSKKGKYIIYSVFQNYQDINLDLEKHAQHIRILKARKQPFKVVSGVYKDIGGNIHEELSILRPLKDNLEAAIIRGVNKQESVLILDNYKQGLYKASLLFEDKIKDVGYFRQVSEDVATKQDSYTIDKDNTYYICTESDATTADELIKLGLKG